MWISERFLGKVEEGFSFTPKHRSNAYSAWCVCLKCSKRFWFFEMVKDIQRKSRMIKKHYSST